MLGIKNYQNRPMFHGAFLKTKIKMAPFYGHAVDCAKITADGLGKLHTKYTCMQQKHGF